MNLIIKEGLIVSCQALKSEPLYGGDTIAKMALASMLGGAVAIRANTVKDINKIYRKLNGKLPIIGLIKKEYSDSCVYITPTITELKKLIRSKSKVIAIDATNRKRPNGEKLEELVRYAREHSNKELMADVATIEEAKIAEQLGFDYISSTMRGYTADTKNYAIPDINFLDVLKKEIKKSVVIAEGGINSADLLKKALELGYKSVVIGGAITRPLSITKNYVSVFKTVL
jgi:N-acylglucosamine-6-phosphate 2-epimerase